MQGTVFRIQRFSLHDGPGIRTTAFFKGCSLRCPWCHNPEGLANEPELQFLTEKCIGCGCCGDRSSLAQADACPSGALSVCGECIEASVLAERLLRDRPYYGEDGGVTLSGGECLLQPDFAAEVLSLVKKRGVHTAIDTSGAVPWSAFEKTMSACDLYLYDIKCIDAERHRMWIGADNARILDNARRLSACGKRMWVRVPIIPGFNTDEEELKQIAHVISTLASVERVTLMPYHTLGKSKYETLGIHCAYEGDPSKAHACVERYYRLFPHVERPMEGGKP